MAEVLRKSLAPLLLAGGLAALAGCSGYSHHETAANTQYPYGESSTPKPYDSNATYGNPSCTVGPTAGNNAGCETQQDQSLAPRH